MIFLNEHKITVLLHPSIPSKGKILTGQISNTTLLIDGIISILCKDKQASAIIFDNNNNIRPGFLLLSNKVELKSTGLLNSYISSDLEIKIIPISHGG